MRWGGAGDEEGIVATTCLRSPGPNVHYSACLASNIEQMFATGTPPYDVRYVPATALTYGHSRQLPYTTY